MEFDELIKRLNAVADAGLFYGKDVFDIERYHEIKAILPQLLKHSTTLTKEELTDLFRPNNSYPTPMIDVRAFIQNEEKRYSLFGIKCRETGPYQVDMERLDLRQVKIYLRS